MSALFRDRLRAGALLAGTWVKTPSPMVVEVLALTALDVLCLDAEHAPFDRASLDLCILAARAAGKPCLVRPASAASEHLLNALDLGASGVVVPHVATVQTARAVALACRYGGPAGRGYAGSSRAAGYGARSMSEHLAQSAGAAAVIAQIEDSVALDEIGDIAAVEGIDALFIGRADLAVSLGQTSPDAPVVFEACKTIARAARDHGRACGIFVARLDEVPVWRDLGVGLFLLQSDHQFLKIGASALVSAIHPPVKEGRS